MTRTTNLRRQSRTALPLVVASLAMVAALALAACSSGSGSSSSASSAPGTTSTTTSPATSAASQQATVWLCRPGLADDPCTADLTTTVVAANGTATVARPQPATDPPIDCFYVYPTVSQEQTANSDLVVGTDETSVARAQASRFSQVCKVYAPMYRQATLATILGGAQGEVDRDLAYRDVEAAWNDYLAHDNHGRGVVLIGHSQGSFVLTRLIERKIDDDPKVRKQLVSALLLGGNVTVATGKDVGGSFQHVPACRSNDQTGCVVAYSAFLTQPPAKALFGRTNQAGQSVLCVNPATLGGHNGVLDPYVPSAPTLLGSGLKDFPTDLKTPWASFPSLYKAHCEDVDGASWLQVDDVRGPGDDRPELAQTLGDTWGLHLVDVNVAYGNLVDLVRSQGAAWHS